MARKLNRVGESFKTKDDLGGYIITIVEYNSADDLLVQFQDEYGVIIHTNYQKCKEGTVKNPYHPSVYEHGYLGLMSDGSKPRTRVGNSNVREYDLWHNLMRRLFSGNYSTYNGLGYSEEILCYAYFVEFILPNIPNYDYWVEHPNERFSLDKDILGANSNKKGYYIENLMFVSIQENSKESNVRNNSIPPIVGRKVKGVCINNNEVVFFESITQASRILNISKNGIWRCCKGINKTCGGYYWSYVD